MTAPRINTGMLVRKRSRIALALILGPQLTQAEIERGRAEMATLTKQIEQRLETPKGEQNEQSNDR